MLVVLALFGWAAVVAAAVCGCRTLWEFLGRGIQAVWRGLGPWQTGRGDPRLTGVGGGEPAHLAYWWRQSWADALSAGRAGLRTVWSAFTGPWLNGTVKNLFRGRRPAGRPGSMPLTRFLLAVLIAPGTAAGALVGAVLATLLLGWGLVLFALLLAVVWLGWAAAVPVLRGLERGWALVRGIRARCPHPGCYAPVPLALHRCPKCQAHHAELRPGRYGVLGHVCRCGHRLPATRLAGRGKLTALCPRCEQFLPRAGGTMRVVHMPLVGGTSSGKTMLMAAMVEGLHAWARQGELRVEYATVDDQRTQTGLTQELNRTGWAHATTGGPPRALMLTVTRGRRRRLLYLYDPMGESVSDAERVRAQQYLAHTDGVVLVADVLADPKVRGLLSPADSDRANRARPSSQGPWETYQRLTGELAALTGRRSRMSVATVVTKRDVLDQLGSLPVPGAHIGEWLTGIGLDRLVRALGHDFGAARYWAVSAHAATGTGPLESEQRRAAEPVLWLLAASGLRTGPLTGSGGSAAGRLVRPRRRPDETREGRYSKA
ncbi:aromatic ring-opening dioxygenase LigA [Streptomyces cellostaticus]|uniref:Aromatic ring-opening dioxygenase LigA n=1 Tax=Streptomyces cellostaticus TaxID=67285 RepID=A0A101NMU4_9ACTN|nr:aromatic ring-opening dioxygenase LigA [Streptomyces cellostaticus]